MWVFLTISTQQQEQQSHIWINIEENDYFILQEKNVQISFRVLMKGTEHNKMKPPQMSSGDKEGVGKLESAKDPPKTSRPRSMRHAKSETLTFQNVTMAPTIPNNLENCKCDPPPISSPHGESGRLGLWKRAPSSITTTKDNNNTKPSQNNRASAPTDNKNSGAAGRLFGRRWGWGKSKGGKGKPTEVDNNAVGNSNSTDKEGSGGTSSSELETIVESADANSEAGGSAPSTPTTPTVATITLVQQENNEISATNTQQSTQQSESTQQPKPPPEDECISNVDTHIIALSDSKERIEGHWNWLKENVIVICSFFDRSSLKEEKEMWKFLVMKLKSLAEEEAHEARMRESEAAAKALATTPTPPTETTTTTAAPTTAAEAAGGGENAGKGDNNSNNICNCSDDMNSIKARETALLNEIIAELAAAEKAASHVMICQDEEGMKVEEEETLKHSLQEEGWVLLDKDTGDGADHYHDLSHSHSSCHCVMTNGHDALAFDEHDDTSHRTNSGEHDSNANHNTSAECHHHNNSTDKAGTDAEADTGNGKWEFGARERSTTKAQLATALLELKQKFKEAVEKHTGDGTTPKSAKKKTRMQVKTARARGIGQSLPATALPATARRASIAPHLHTPPSHVVTSPRKGSSSINLWHEHFADQPNDNILTCTLRYARPTYVLHNNCNTTHNPQHTLVFCPARWRDRDECSYRYRVFISTAASSTPRSSSHGTR